MDNQTRVSEYFHREYSENQEQELILQNKAIHLQWKKFVNGDGDVDITLVSHETLEAWERCRAMHIDPLTVPQNVLLTGEALKEKLHEHQNFINISRPFLRKLIQSLKGFSYTVALFDAEGYMLHHIEEKKAFIYNRNYNFIPGSRWTYDYVGNSAIAHVLKTKTPMQVIGAKHYLNCLHFITSTGEPILDPDGALLGCLSVGHFYSDTHPITRGLALAAAQAIENEFRVQKTLVQCQVAFEQTDIASSLQKVIFASIPEAIIAVNNEGRVISINEKACDMFALNIEDVPGTPLRMIFDRDGNRSFFAVLEQQDSVRDLEVRIRTSRGEADYSLTCNNISLSAGTIIGKVLIFSEIKRIRSLVAKTIGAKANFTFKDIHGQNNAFQFLMDQARSMSQSASNVLLLGESGTGKDILAQAIHNASPRKDGPYIAINCAAIPRDLIASELFGHMEGAFTGARRGGRQGKFELADGGTIFLDEIAEIPLDIQAVLLRVLEDKQVVRIGGTQVRKVDVRIIAATNRDLLEEVNRGNFRQELFYRLNVCNIELPALRERPDDIPMLTERFISKFAKAQDKTISGVDEKVMEALVHYRWPGNVRELQNVVERMVNYASEGHLTTHLVPPEIVDTRPVRRQSLDFELPSEKEKRLLRHMLTLNLSKNNIAKQLNMSRTTLYRKINKYGLLT